MNRGGECDALLRVHAFTDSRSGCGIPLVSLLIPVFLSEHKVLLQFVGSLRRERERDTHFAPIYRLCAAAEPLYS